MNQKYRFQKNVTRKIQNSCSCSIVYYFCVNKQPMTEQVHLKIDAIHRKIVTLVRQLHDERDKNADFQEKLRIAENQLHVHKQQEAVFQLEIEALTLEVEKSQVVDLIPLGQEKEGKINELVKEIDYCISQLKR